MRMPAAAISSAAMRASTMVSDAMRGSERWSGKQTMHRTFTGMAALPAGAIWYEVLGVAPDASRADIEDAYRRLVKSTHPDAGGERERFLEVQGAYREARAV
jgi:DnaJ-domain-containing protein 1